MMMKICQATTKRIKPSWIYAVMTTRSALDRRRSHSRSMATHRGRGSLSPRSQERLESNHRKVKRAPREERRREELQRAAATMRMDLTFRRMKPLQKTRNKKANKLTSTSLARCVYLR